MPTRISSGKVSFEFQLGPAMAAPRHQPGAPLQILVAGDFCGRSTIPLIERPVFEANCDNLDAVIRQMTPTCEIDAAGSRLQLKFAQLEDFHPDRLIPRIGPMTDSSGQPTASGAGTEDNTHLLGRLMGGSASAHPPKPIGGAVDISALLNAAVGSSARTSSAADDAAASSTQLTLTKRLREVLHNRGFQDVEAAWRGLDMLVREFGGEENVQLHVFDLRFDELANDLTGSHEPQSCALFQLLHQRQAERKFTLILGLWMFAATAEDFDLLQRVAKICAAQRATLIAGAAASLLGLRSFEKADVRASPLSPDLKSAWQSVRELPEAKHIALACPRFLLRQPYGAAADPIDSFGFEELPPELPHAAFLWGNPALLCGHVLIEAFLAKGRSAVTSGDGEVGGLPVYRYEADGEKRVMPCAETWLSESAAELISEQGLTPLASAKGRDAIRVTGIRTIAAAMAPVSLD